MYTITLESVGNPDHGQYQPISNPTHVRTHRLGQLVQAAADYIQAWNLGAGNWPVPTICEDGARISRLSYNLKLISV